VNFELKSGEMYHVRVVQLIRKGDHAAALKKLRPLIDRTTSDTSVVLDTRKMKVGTEVVWQVTVVSGKKIVASSASKGIIISRDTSDNPIAWHDRRSIEHHSWYKTWKNDHCRK
jgi:hypothetical protein